MSTLRIHAVTKETPLQRPKNKHALPKSLFAFLVNILDIMSRRLYLLAVEICAIENFLQQESQGNRKQGETENDTLFKKI